MADKIAVLIPCYNESKTVAKVIRDMKKALPEAVIYVYDNNSTDGTDEIARKEGAVVRYEHQQGKGNVIRRLYRKIANFRKSATICKTVFRKILKIIFYGLRINTQP